MIPILYDSTEKSFQSNGIGRLSDCISCNVVEERNGQYELTMTYPINGIHFSEIQEDRYIGAIPFDGGTLQPFHIYKISKPLSGQVEINAEHISYLLTKATVLPFSASSCADCFSKLNSYIVGLPNIFNFTTKVSSSTAYSQTIPKSVRSVLGGDEDSFLDIYGGDYEFDRFNVILHQSRGSDNDVVIRYGKNLTDMTAETDMTDTYTGVVPYYSSGDNIVVGSVQYSGHESSYAYPMVVPLDLTSEYDEVPSAETLNARAVTYMTENQTWSIMESLTVKFVNLWQTEEYADIAPLERVNLCDYVSVIHKDLGVTATMRVVTTDYNVLLDRYNSIELGETTATMSSVVNNISTTVKSEVSENTTNEIAVAIAANNKTLIDQLDKRYDERYEPKSTTTT
jgi:phage minor structural protein